MSYLKPLYEQKRTNNSNDSIIEMLESVYNDDESFDTSESNRLNSLINDIIENDPEIRALDSKIAEKEERFRKENDIYKININVIESLFKLIPQMGDPSFQYYWDSEESIWGEDITIYNSSRFPIAKLSCRGALFPLSTEMTEEDRIGINLLLKLTNTNVDITNNWTYSDNNLKYSIADSPRIFELIDLK